MKNRYRKLTNRKDTLPVLSPYFQLQICGKVTCTAFLNSSLYRNLVNLLDMSVQLRLKCEFHIAGIAGKFPLRMPRQVHT